MALDPNVQVALVGVIGIAITTSGVIIAAIINNRKERQKAATAGVEAGLDEKDVLGRIVSLLKEIEALELTVAALKKRNRELVAENRVLRESRALEEEGP